MIELGKHSEMPNVSGAVMFHSTESGRFMAAGRKETAEFLEAVKRGEFDDLFTDPPAPEATP